MSVLRQERKFGNQAKYLCKGVKDAKDREIRTFEADLLEAGKYNHQAGKSYLQAGKYNFQADKFYLQAGKFYLQAGRSFLQADKFLKIIQ